MLCGMDSHSHPEAAPRLLVIADSLLSRAGLSALLAERGCHVLAAVDGARPQAHIDRLEPDALVVDCGWDSQAMRQSLSEIDADLPLLALAATEERQTLSLLMQSLRAFPQFAMLPRDSQPDAIISALDALSAGLCAIEPGLASLLAMPGQAPQESPPSPLTAREHQVLQLLAQGLTNRAIALQLGITQHTVKFHVNAIMSKLDAQSRTEAVVRATQLGMITL